MQKHEASLRRLNQVVEKQNENFIQSKEMLLEAQQKFSEENQSRERLLSRRNEFLQMLRSLSE